MRKILLLITFIMSVSLLANDDSSAATANDNIRTVSSPQNRVAVLELYTSEGCSSCPPADRFLSSLKESGISDKRLIPMAFHVTYWDYIGWKDRFAKKQYDRRQRDLAYKNRKSTVYTPQFILSGIDYRRYSNLDNDVNQLVNQRASVDLTLSAQVETNVSDADVLHLKLSADVLIAKVHDIGFYFVVLENNLMSKVNDGENEGEHLHHDYVVRQMLGPYHKSKDEMMLGQKHIEQEQVNIEQRLTLQSEWKKQDLSIVVLAENQKTGEVLQAVRLDY